MVALSDDCGNIVETYEYSVYGETRILGTSSEPRYASIYGNPYMFTSRRFDSETGLYYYRARYYYPYIGRFPQTDPIGYKDNMNLYTYVGNNPVLLIDPWGLCGEPAWYSPRAIFDELTNPRINENLQAIKYYADNLKRTLQYKLRVNAIGLDTNAAFVQPFTSGASGVVGGVNRMWGGEATGRYYYDSLERGNTGVDIGFAGQIVLAQGRGQWAGEFDTYTINIKLITLSYFESPSGNWRGISFGVGLGLPLGAAKERTTYEPLIYDFER